MATTLKIARFVWKPVKWLLNLVRALFLAWGGLALYYSELPGDWLRLILALAFMVFGVWALWLSRSKWSVVALIVVFMGIATYWSTIQPSHDRIWRSDMALMPRAVIDGDNVRLINYRNFDYRSVDDYDVRYEERVVQLSHLTSVDFYISYWMPGPVAHTFVSFNFDNADPVVISIEARFEKDEGYDPLASMFKQFELIYIVGDERDLVRVRTNYRKEDVFRYDVRSSPENARRLFLVYLDRINELADHPEFYHLLSNNCTINIVRYVNRAGRVGSLDIRHVLNGFSDRYLYNVGALDNSIPFAELRRRANINAAAQAAGNSPDFSRLIRKVPQ